MRPAMLVSAAAVLALGLVPGLAAEAVTRAGGIGGVGRVGLAGLELSGVGAQLDPVALSVMALLLAVPVLFVSLAAARATAPTSGGAGVGLRGSPGQPAHAVHRDLLRRAVGPGLRRRAATRTGHRGHPHQRVAGTSSSAWSSASGSTTSWRNGPTDPIVRLADRVGLAARRLQNGSIHRYLGYSFVALVAVLVLVAL